MIDHIAEQMPLHIPNIEANVSVTVEGATLAVWDTESAGPAVILLHPFSTNGAVWQHQLGALADAGYRAISYSRRGYHPSTPNHDPTLMGEVTAGNDLAALLTALEIRQAHIVAVAGGGAVAVDYLLTPGARTQCRILSLALVSSLCGVHTGRFAETTRRLLPPGWRDLPPEFRELGPSYRAANPDGTAAWRNIALQAKPAARQPTPRAGTCEVLRAITVPTLLLTGSADLFLPPSQQSQLARYIEHAETAVLAESGHAGQWEQPEEFNAVLLDFLGRHPSR